MGIASRWLRAVLGLKKPDSPSQQNSTKDKRRWSFVKSNRENDNNKNKNNTSLPAKRCVVYEDHHPSAVAVAEATASVAEAAVVAAHAAAEVVRLTSSGRCGVSEYSNGHGSSDVDGGVNVDVGWCEDYAAVRIQAVFRGYLARRALRALRALVRLQALVRGNIERKQMALRLHRMHAVLQVQARARAGRAQISPSSNSSTKSSHLHHPSPSTPEKTEQVGQARSRKYEQSPVLKRTPSKSSYVSRSMSNEDKAQLSFNWSERHPEDQFSNQRIPLTWTGSLEEYKNDRIVEIDKGRQHSALSKRRSLFHSPHHAFSADQYSRSFTTSKDSANSMAPSPFSGEVQSSTPFEFAQEPFFTVENSPQFYSATSQAGISTRSPFTPTKNDGLRSFLSGFSDHPNYMSYTESSRAKVRSVSAPKQRAQYERSSSGAKRQTMNLLGEQRSTSVRRASCLQSNFTSKSYPGSGRLDRLGMPVGNKCSYY